MISFKSIKIAILVTATLLLTDCRLPVSLQASTSLGVLEETVGWTHLSSANGDLPAPSNSKQQTSSLILDIDNDGLLDFVISARETPGPSMVWYQRTSTSWIRHIIDDDVLNIEAGGTYHDIDDDGDLDIVMGGDVNSNKVWWWENPFPNFNSTWTRREIKNTGRSQHHDQIFGDFDGDGKAELVFWNQGSGSLFMADIPPDPLNTEPWSYTTIYRYTDGGAHEGLAKADIDGDGILDIIGGGLWLKHQSENNYIVEIVDDGKKKTRAAVGQLIAGGRPEIVFVIGDGEGPLDWYEWDGSSWMSHNLLGFDVDHGHSLDVADLNNDGNMDIFVAEMRLNDNPDSMMWVFEGDGNGNFVETQVATGYGNHESKLGDLDGDGDLDILGKPYRWDTPRVDIWLNNITTGSLPLDKWKRHVIDDDRPWRAIFISADDLDGDNQQDIVTGGWWYKNPGGDLTNTWNRSEIGTPLNNMAAVYDFDNDSDPDILGTQGRGSEASDTFVWAQNNGLGQFNILENINSGGGDFLQGISIGQLQNNNAVALSWHASNNGIQLLNVPGDPANQTWSWSKISPISQDEDLSSGDVDKDGDLDLLLGTKWLRNEGSDWTAFDLYLPNGQPDRNELADINGDGNLDAVVGFEAIGDPGKLVWYQQEGTPTNLWTEHIIADPAIIGPMSLDVADMDADGDLDIIVGEHNTKNPNSANLYIFENSDGSGLSWTRHLVHTGDEHHDGTQVVDIDNDGDLDIISIGWTHSRVLLYENLADRYYFSNQKHFLPVVTHGLEDNASNQCSPDNNLIALYSFDEGSGNIIYDASGIEPKLDLIISDGNPKWIANGGISIKNPATIVSVNDGSKVNNAIRQANQFTIDVVLKPYNIEQDGPARILSLAAGTQTRNFTLGQGLWGNQPSDVYDFRLRTTNTSTNGLPSITTTQGSADTEKTRLVYIRQTDGNVLIYINDKEVAREFVGGNLSNWDSSFYLTLVNEMGGGRPWLGELYSVAIYNCALNFSDLNNPYGSFEFDEDKPKSYCAGH